jgi:hypothetical protein
LAGKDSQKTEENTGQQIQPAKYPLEDLISNCEALFKCKPEVVYGALHGNTKKEFTVDEIRGLIDKFLKRKVK